jgi:EmrB/QacA subfamily drug resistance transporter
MERKWWTLIAVCVGTFMLLLDVTIVNVALPAIQTSLKATFSDLQWVVDAYALTLAALLLTTGSLADLFGRRRVFVIGLIIFSLSSLASGLATTPLWLNLARGAQGVGGAAMFSTSLALLGSSFQGRERGTAFGAWGAITGLAVAVGPVVGGALTTGISWRWIFLVNVPIGAIAVILCLLRVEESKQPGARRPDLVGFVTFSGALSALVYALIKGNTSGWGSPEILACLIGAGVLLIAFVVAEVVQRDNAMFDLKLFRKPTFTGGAIAAFALSAGLFSLLLYLTLYLQDVLNYSALDTGLRLLVLSGGILLTSTIAGRLTASVPIRFLIAPGLALVGVGLLLMRGLDAGSGWTHLVPGFIVAGAGTGLINPPLASTAIGVVPPERAGMASGINSTFRQIGIATGIAGLGSLFSHTVRTHIVSLLSGAKSVSARDAHSLAEGVAQGNGARAGLAHLPAQARPAAIHAVRAGFVSGLNEVFLVGALLALVSAVLTLILIRSRDFETSAARSHAAPTGDAPARPGDPAPASDGAGAYPKASAPEPAATDGGEHDLRHDAEVVMLAAEQAARDYSRRVAQLIATHRSEQVGSAEAQSRQLLHAALARNNEYAAPLRQRERELTHRRERLVAELREQVDSATREVDRVAQTRVELYRLIGALGSVEGARARSTNGTGDGLIAVEPQPGNQPSP